MQKDNALDSQRKRASALLKKYFQTPWRDWTAENALDR